MYLSPRVRRTLLALPLVAVVFAPGWSASLAPLRYEDMWGTLQTADDAIGVAYVPEEDGPEWHATYVDDGLASVFRSLNLRSYMPHVSPPDFVAFIPAGELHANAHFRVESRMHWPWWWPGGGMDWSAPD